MTELELEKERKERTKWANRIQVELDKIAKDSDWNFEIKYLAFQQNPDYYNKSIYFETIYKKQQILNQEYNFNPKRLNIPDQEYFWLAWAFIENSLEQIKIKQIEILKSTEDFLKRLNK